MCDIIELESIIYESLPSLMGSKSVFMYQDPLIYPHGRFCWYQ